MFWKFWIIQNFFSNCGFLLGLTKSHIINQIRGFRPDNTICREPETLQ